MRILLTALVLATAGCGAPRKQPIGTPPETFCPGGPSCPSGNDGVFQAGIAVVDVSPRAFEAFNPDYLQREGELCNEVAPTGRDGGPRCGELSASAFKDCGKDARCPGDPGYSAPDPDGTQGDGKPDWYFDCGRDQKCPGSPGYAAPDADGSEGDGVYQGYWLAGFGNNRPMDRLHDPLQARALVLQNGDVTLAIVSVDAVGLLRDDVVRIRERVAKKAPGLDYVLVSSTHTHEGPDTLGQWGLRVGLVPARGVDDAWLTSVLIEGTAQAVADAYASLRPARLRAVQAHLGDVSRQVLVDHRDPFVTDDTVTVLELSEKLSGVVLGTLVSWGNHPETLSDVNNAGSADFVWALREAMEKGIFKSDGSRVSAGAGGRCVFVNGAVGGMMSSLRADPTTMDGTKARPRSFAKTKAVGEQVAKVALQALAGAPELPAPPLAFGSQTLKLRLENEAFQLVFGNFDILKRRLYDFDKSKPITASNFPHLLSEISKLQVGELRFLGVPGELLPELAIGYEPAFSYGAPRVKSDNPNPPDLSKAPGPPFLKQQLGGSLPCVVGLANDELGYLVPPYDYQLDSARPYVDQAPGDHYEETNSLGPSVTPTLLEAYRKLLSWEPLP